MEHLKKQLRTLKKKQPKRANNKPKRANNMQNNTFQTASMKHGPAPPKTKTTKAKESQTNVKQRK